MNANPRPIDATLEGKADLTRIEQLRKHKMAIVLHEGHDASDVDDDLQNLCPVDRDVEEATSDNPAYEELSFGTADEMYLVLDTSQTDWQPDGEWRHVDLYVKGESGTVNCQWKAERFSAALAATLWLVTVEIQ